MRKLTISELRQHHENLDSIVWVGAIDNFIERLTLDLLSDDNVDVEPFDGGRFREEQDNEVKEHDVTIVLPGNDIWLSINYTASCKLIYENYEQEELGINKGEIEDWVNLEIDITSCRLYIEDAEFDMMWSKELREELIIKFL